MSIKRIDEIEDMIARGQMNAAQVFAQMKQVCQDSYSEIPNSSGAVGIAQSYNRGHGMTQCVFTDKAVPVGAKLYTYPASAAPLQFGNGNLVVTDGSFDDVPAVFISPAIDLGNAPDTALSGKDAERRTDMLYGDETVLLFKTAEHASVVAGALIRGNDASNYRLTLGQRKAAQIGETIGVLAQNQEGRVCAVTDLGRCTWLSEDVTGANHKYNRDSDEAMGKKLSVYPEPTKADEPPSVPEEWRTTMKELADDLESEIEARRSGDLDRRIERDLIVVKEARVLLDEQEQGGPTKSALKPSGFGDMNDMELQELANTCRRAKQDQG